MRCNYCYIIAHKEGCPGSYVVKTFYGPTGKSLYSYLRTKTRFSDVKISIAKRGKNFDNNGPYLYVFSEIEFIRKVTSLCNDYIDNVVDL